MAYTLSILVSLGASSAGLTLKAQIVDTTGSNVGAEITTGIVELGGGEYLATISIPDGTRGAVKFYTGTLPSGYKASVAINGQEVENADVKTSTVSGGGGTGISVIAPGPAGTCVVYVDVGAEGIDGSLMVTQLPTLLDNASYALGQTVTATSDSGGRITFPALPQGVMVLLKVVDANIKQSFRVPYRETWQYQQDI